MGYVTASDGARIFYKDWGAGRPVVLSHGWPLNSDSREAQALRADPTPIATATVPDTLTHLEKVVAALPEKPVIIGHSFGGTLTQLLLDRGHGAAGVVINSAPPEGIRMSPPSQIRSLFPILKNPAKRHQAAGFTPEEFHHAFANTLSEEDFRAAYDRYAIAAPGSWVWAYGLLANLTPGKQETWVNFHNPDRAPLLFIAGGEDHIMPPSVNRSNARHYKAPGTVTEYVELPGRSHWTCAEPGWEQIAVRPASRGRTIAMIARQWGFADPTHFTRRFRAAYGITPSEWRRAGTSPEA